MNQISSLAFCGVRRLNAFEGTNDDVFEEWMNNRRWYDFGSVNLFIGVNGGGKSTVLELIDMLREPSRLVSLPRENKRNTWLTAFDIVFQDDKRLIGMSYPHAIPQAKNASNIEAQQGGNVQSLDLIGFEGRRQILRFIKNISKSELDEDSREELSSEFLNLGCNVEYWTADHDAKEQELVEILNRAGPHLAGIVSPGFKGKNAYEDAQAFDYKKTNPFRVLDDGRLGIWLSDDIGQQNHVHTSALPSGWRRLASIISWLNSVPASSVCLLEEPETHLHPRLQRLLAKEMDAITHQRSLQLFISTHSTVFQQSNLWKATSRVFVAKGDVLDEFSSAWPLIEALGIRGSDISQSNGIVWVEGPSDRRYIKHWLSLYCRENGKPEFRENVDYSFNFYGGALLSHMSLQEQDSFISMLSMNRNMVLVMDRDKDFVEGTDGELICVKPGSAKLRVLEELETLPNSAGHIWVTDRYTIESYLPKDFLYQYFSIENEGRLTLLKGSKVEIAIRYSAIYARWDNCSCLPDKLFRHIDKIYRSIERWNS